MYYRAENINPNWYAIFTDQLADGIDLYDILDQICELACGIKVGASDECQRYAKHIYAHLIAAFKLGEQSNTRSTRPVWPEDVRQN